MKTAHPIAELSAIMPEKSHNPRYVGYMHFPHHWRLRVLPESQQRGHICFGVECLKLLRPGTLHVKESSPTYDAFLPLGGTSSPYLVLIPNNSMTGKITRTD